MFQTLLHNKYLRLLTGLLGAVIHAAAINLFVVPQGFYSGGLYGVCQVIRTLLVQQFGLVTPVDLAGVLYLLLNIPLLILAWRSFGRPFVIRMTVCTAVDSIALALIPSPAVPIVADPLSACLIGGICSGFACGLILTCGCSTGGLDVLGLYLSKKGSRFTVGKFSISFNAVLYAACALIFSLHTALYSVIYTVFASLFLDRAHQQNISVQMLIFTKNKSEEMRAFIIERLSRGVTLWKGRGGYTNEPLEVLCVCLNKYEVLTTQQMLREVDSNAFFIVQEGVQVGGHFERHLL